MIEDRFIADIRRDMLKFAQLQLRDAALAEDAVQEALTAALAGEHRFAGQASLKTWVFAILRNKIVDCLRHQARVTNVSALHDEDAGLDEAFDALFATNGHWRPETRPRGWGDPQDSLEQKAFWDVFDLCLNHLPDKTARVFMMREFLEFETAEVCSTLGISVANCNVILHRARNGLRRCLENGWFASGDRAS